MQKNNSTMKFYNEKAAQIEEAEKIIKKQLFYQNIWSILGVTHKEKGQINEALSIEVWKSL